MLSCKLCKGRIEAGDEYAKDEEYVICLDCLGRYILDAYDIIDIAQAIGIDILEHEDPEPEEKPEPQIPGQIDIFGNIAT